MLWEFEKNYLTTCARATTYYINSDCIAVSPLDVGGICRWWAAQWSPTKSGRSASIASNYAELFKKLSMIYNIM